MILERLTSESAAARALGTAFDAACTYLRSTDFRTLKLNTIYPIANFGDQMFAQVSEYHTQPKEERKSEQHRAFIDIHHIISGIEIIGMCFEDSRNVVAQAYTKEIDATLYTTVVHETDILLTAGSYAVLFPTDIHRPRCMVGQPAHVRKVVIKIAVDLVVYSRVL